MKNIFILLLFSFSLGKSLAQDTIIKNSSEKIIAKILEISPTEIKYKKFDFIDGPTYIELKSGIKMVVYSNGTKEVFEQKMPEKPVLQASSDDADYYGGKNASNNIEVLGKVKFKQNGKILNEKKLQNILLQTNDRPIMALVKDSKKSHGLQYIGFAAIPIGIIGLTLLSSSAQYSYAGQVTYNEAMLAGGGLCLVAAAACPIASGMFKKRRLNDNRAAIKLYNQKF